MEVKLEPGALEPGTYIVAVSGGVDSMVLLNLLSEKPELRLVVAHFDHGIRPDSHKDRLLVQKTADKLRLPFVFHEGKLGSKASEEKAREARYEFLQRVRRAADAKAIVTAHHQDDALETAVHNLLRGTGRKGLSAVYQNTSVRRPLLHLPKTKLLGYAKKRDLKWREDSTNDDLTYTRNYIRHKVIPKLSDEQKSELLTLIEGSHKRNETIDRLVQELLKTQKTKNKIDKRWFVSLPHPVAKELLAAWLRRHKIRDFDKKLIEQLVIAAKTQKNNSFANVNRQYKLKITSQFLALVPLER